MARIRRHWGPISCSQGADSQPVCSWFAPTIAFRAVGRRRQPRPGGARGWARVQRRLRRVWVLLSLCGCWWIPGFRVRAALPCETVVCATAAATQASPLSTTGLPLCAAVRLRCPPETGPLALVPAPAAPRLCVSGLNSPAARVPPHAHPRSPLRLEQGPALVPMLTHCRLSCRPRARCTLCLCSSSSQIRTNQTWGPVS